MKSKLFNLNFKDVLSAVISGVIVSVLGYISSLTNIADVSIAQIGNIALLTAVTSLLKALSTDETGKLLGAIEIK